MFSAEYCAEFEAAATVTNEQIDMFFWADCQIIAPRQGQIWTYQLSCAICRLACDRIVGMGRGTFSHGVFSPDPTVSVV
jgi:hypothetical protein